jgi:DNA-binding CsgD family transcriptional regulator
LWAWGYASWRQGDADAAAERARAALAIQRDFADPVGAALIIELLAWIAGSERRHRDAVRHLALAECLWQRVGTGIAAFGPHHLAHHERCRARSGEALGDGAVEAAVLHAQELTVAEAIDRALGHEDAEADTSAGVSAPELRGPLTRREWEVARLLATGRTNRAIADMLVVSPRTVDGHVERILAKLGFRSRAQVAAWVGEHVARARDGEVAARPAASTGS